MHTVMEASYRKPGDTPLMLFTVSLLKHSQCDTLSTVSASKPGDDPKMELSALGRSDPLIRQDPGGVGFGRIRLLS